MLIISKNYQQNKNCHVLKIKTMNTRKILFLIACLCVSAAMHAQIRLSFNPTVGETYSYRIVSEMQTRQTIMGMEMPSNMVSEMLVEMTATEKNNDEVRMNFSYLSSAMEVASPMMTFRVDSEADIATLSGFEREMAELLQTFVGQTMNIVFGTDGSVKSIFGVAIDTTNPAIAMVQSLFGEDAMMQMLKQSFNIFPSQEVRVGDSWNNNMNMVVQGMNTSAQITYTLTSITDNVASIDMVTTMTITGADATITGEISGEGRGTIKLDVATGMIISSNQEGSVSGTIQTGGMSVAMEMITRATVTLE